MASLKRKRLLVPDSISQPRRATRQHPADPEEHQLRSGRVLPQSSNKPIDAHVESPEGRGKKNDASKTKPTRTVAASTNAITSDALKGSTRQTKLTGLPIARKNATTEPTENTTTQLAVPSPPPQTRLAPPSRKPASQPDHHHPTHPTPTEKTTTTPKRSTSSPNKPPIPPGTPRPDRNIDKVVLGSICFKAWYPSYYGKDVLGDASGNGGDKDGRDGGGKIGRIGGGKRAGLPPPMLDRLYVCPCCFKYSKELVTWWEHVRCCEALFDVPGRMVYTHPKGSKTVRRPASGPVGAEAAEKGRGRGRKKSDAEAGAAAGSFTEDVVEDEGEWSVWEVDGEKDRLFCQNLSLFAKLFLDNKSVFFDVTGFNYFLLVYSPPPPSLEGNLMPQFTEANDPPFRTSTPEGTRSRPQVVGFFSKEKQSWDNNNLACILVFPPWQRKGLGALLMGVSYEISRREGILGGPEKPISELGRKGYKRFWAGEIARWLLLPPSSLRPDATTGSTSSSLPGEEELGWAAEKQTDVGESLTVTVDQCSRATWIVPEDCLAVLREMGVVEDVGLLGPPERPGTGHSSNGGDSKSQAERRGTSNAGNGRSSRSSRSSRHGTADTESQAGDFGLPTAPRVRVDRAAVRRWVAANGIDLSHACDPDGFVEGYAVKACEDGEGDED
ncbi:acyl-CoA N-acyltransferase [Hypoxylon sp. FL1284]|nr:acyl-CoA N-acyltransferase [Hypoxylon sp. FL1284]